MPCPNSAGGQNRTAVQYAAKGQKRALPLSTSHPVISATDRSNVSLHGILQNLLGARMDHPFEVVAVHPIEREGHQRSTDRTDGLLGKRDEVRNAAHE